MPVIGSFIRQNGQNSEYINRMYEIQKDMNDDYERSDAGKQRNGLVRYPRIPLGSSAYTMDILIISAICKGLAVPIFRTRFLTRSFIFFLTIRRHLYFVGVSPFLRLFARFAAKKATSRDFITKSRSSSVRL